MLVKWDSITTVAN